MPNLKETQIIWAGSAKRFFVSKLKTALSIRVNSAKKFSAPKLIEVSEICAYSAETIEL